MFVNGTFNFLFQPDPENGIWVLPQNMGDVDFEQLNSSGINNIYLHSAAVDEFSQEEIESWIQQANAYGIKVHIWVPIFYDDSGWVLPEDTNGVINQGYINEKLDKISYYSQIKGISGVQLDYLRFPGGAESYPNSNEVLNDFAHQARDRVKDVNSSLIVSITIMPETYWTLFESHNDYGQDYRELSSVADVVVIMMYKGNYNQDSSWIQDRTSWFVKNSRGAQVVIGLQTYESESYALPLSSYELSNDAQAALDGGAGGISLFRAGLINMFNVTALE